MADAFPIRGNIDPQTFPFILADLHRRGATGSLKVEGPAYPKALYFRTGRVLFGSSNDPRDQLGAILIENGKLSQEQLDEVNGKVGPGNPLAKVLADSGFVNQRELSEAARTKVERILADVIAYSAGSFEFEDGVLPKGAVDLKLATERLLIAAVRRITDRAFVLRHLGGMDVVLGPTEALPAALPEIRSEAGGLTEHLDGQTTLTSGAAAARLEEFDAAKVACALLFLGLLRLAGVTTPSELDLAETAHRAFGGVTTAGPEEEGPFFLAEEPAALSVVPNAPFVLPPMSVVPAEAPVLDPFVLPPAPATPDLLFTSPAVAPAPTVRPERPAPAPIPALPPPPKPEPELPQDLFRASMSPPAPVRTFEIETVPTGFAPDPYLVPPDGSLSSVPTASKAVPAFDDDAPEPAPPSRPSREDLAALDALLNPAGGTKAPGPPSSSARPRPRSDWEPQFQVGATSSPRGRGRDSSGSRRGVILFSAIAVLSLGLGAWHYFVGIPGLPPLPGSRPSAAPPPNPVLAQRPTPFPIASPTPEIKAPDPAAPAPGDATTPAAVPSTTPAAVATTPPPPPPTRAPTATPTPRPVAASSPPLPPPGSSLGAARQLLAAGDFPRAAQTFEAALRSEGDRRFTLQVLVACMPETVQKAVAGAPGTDLMLFPASVNGKSCYRMAWGLYASDAEARAALSTVPAHFRSGGTPKAQKLSNLVK